VANGCSFETSLTNSEVFNNFPGITALTVYGFKVVPDPVVIAVP
jgi:hypothetical protein